MGHTIVAFGGKLPDLTVTAASFAPSSSPISFPNPWEIELGFSCIPTTY
ncbi:hypothetical protein CUMW_150430, partial [Citrus unshiu]